VVARDGTVVAGDAELMGIMGVAVMEVGMSLM